MSEKSLFEQLKTNLENKLRRMWSESDTQMIMATVDEILDAFVKALKQEIQEKQNRNEVALDSLKNLVKQEDYDSMTEKQRNAQALAVIYALKGTYEEFLASFEES